MNKTILSAIFSSFIMLGLPSQANADIPTEFAVHDFQGVTISVAGSVLKVSGANGEMLQVYNVAGMRVMNVRVEGDEKRYDLELPRGCYIIKVGKYVRKIALR